MSTIGWVTEKADLKYRETAIGYVPDGGSTFVLSRLPGKLGVFLALTGRKLFAEDLIGLGYAERSFEGFNDEFNEKLDLLRGEIDIHNLDFFEDKFTEAFKKYKKGKDEKLIKQYENMKERLSPDLSKHYIEPFDRKVDPFGEIDLKYKEEIQRRNKLQGNLFTFKDFKGRIIQSHIQIFRSFLLEQFEPKGEGNTLMDFYEKEINRLFSKNSVSFYLF